MMILYSGLLFLGHPVYCVEWGVKLYSLTHSVVTLLEIADL